MKKEITLELKGFKTMAQAKAFLNWYKGQGEQDADYWFEERQGEGEIDIDSMHINIHKKYVETETTLTAWLNI